MSAIPFAASAASTVPSTAVRNGLGISTIEPVVLHITDGEETNMKDIGYYMNGLNRVQAAVCVWLF